jgi:hypothetical protein
MDTRKKATVAGLAAAVAALAALPIAVPGAARADVPQAVCGVTCDDGGGYDATTVQLEGPFQATPVSPATVAADVGSGGYTAESDPSLSDPTSAACKMHPPYGCVPLVCYRTGSHPLWTKWGLGPTGQVVYEDRVWCGYANWYQTYRASRLRTGTGGSASLCSANDPRYNYKTAGGNGYFYTDVHTGSHFSCSVWPGVSAGFQDFQVWRCNMSGYCIETNYGHE